MINRSLIHKDDFCAERILIFTSTDKDSSLASRVLASAGIECEVCSDIFALSAALDRGVGAVLTVEEVLMDRALPLLSDYIRRQPDWSDLPILVLTGEGADSVRIQQAIKTLGNLILLERPVRTTTLISSVLSALRARARQYQIRDANEQLQENE